MKISQTNMKGWLLQRIALESGPHGICWVWKLKPNEWGFGHFTRTSDYKNRQAHIQMYEEYRGALPAGKALVHLCDKNICINPWHLKAVDTKEAASIHRQNAKIEPIRVPVKDRLLRRRQIQSTEHGECWLWTGPVARDGYALIGDGPKLKLIHRAAYEEWIGPIPEGKEIHHRCSNRTCFNPDHLQPLTRREHTYLTDSPTSRNAAKIYCINGHLFLPENTYQTKTGNRNCRECMRRRMKEYRIRVKSRATNTP